MEHQPHHPGQRANMPESNHSEPRILEINKYPNRRYYDITRSRHISLQQIHKAIIEGCNVRVVDAKTKEDITSQVLTQILLEYEPLKLAQFSNELLTQTIRVNDKVLKDFVDLYFRQAFEAFCLSQKQVDQILRQTHQLQSVLPKPVSWAGNFFSPWMQGPFATAARPSADTVSSPPPGNTEKMETRMPQAENEIAALRRKVSTLKTQLSARARRKSKRSKK